LAAMTLELIGCFGGRDFRYVYANGDRVEYVVSLYRCIGALPRIAEVDSETVELRYFARSEFPGLPLGYPIDRLYAATA